MYKEYDDSAWNLWRAHARDKGVRTLEAFVHGDPEAIKAALKDAQAKHKEVSERGKTATRLPRGKLGPNGCMAAARVSVQPTDQCRWNVAHSLFVESLPSS